MSGNSSHMAKSIVAIQDEPKKSSRKDCRTSDDSDPEKQCLFIKCSVVRLRFQEDLFNIQLRDGYGRVYSFSNAPAWQGEQHALPNYYLNLTSSELGFSCLSAHTSDLITHFTCLYYSFPYLLFNFSSHRFSHTFNKLSRLSRLALD
jgi:hypothetical protein